MPASADRRSLLQAVVQEVVELERLCAELENGIGANDWPRCDALLADVRRVTHALRNALVASEGQRDEAFDIELKNRVRRIMEVRDGQLDRLRDFHEVVGEKLRTLSNWKVYARSIGARELPRPSAGLDSTR